MAKTASRTEQAHQVLPQKVIYMRWQYGNADQPGNKKALQWYHDNKLKTMGATAVQTTYAMLPLGGFINNIKSFQTARQDIPIEGVCVLHGMTLHR